MKTVLALLIVLAVLGGGYVWYMQNSTSTGSANIGSSAPTENTVTPPSGEQTGGVNVGADVGVNAGAVKEFAFTNEGLRFSPNAFSVKKGDRVRVTYTNGGGMHNFRIDGYGLGTRVIETSGQSQTFEFVADKVGTFEFYCSVGQHRQLGMRGTFTVTE